VSTPEEIERSAPDVVDGTDVTEEDDENTKSYTIQIRNSLAQTLLDSTVPRVRLRERIRLNHVQEDCRNGRHNWSDPDHRPTLGLDDILECRWCGVTGVLVVEVMR
jgi:hypothetical protein